MSGRPRWQEPVLALAGFALALAGAGVGVAVVDVMSSDDDIAVIPLASSATEPPSSVTAPPATPTPQTAETDEPAATPTATQQEATATPTATAKAATATPTKRATSTPTPRPPTATPTPRPPTATPTPRPPTATPTPVPGSGLVLDKTTFALPSEAVANGGASIGPFCCQGRTVTVKTTGGDIVAYAYWYRWTQGWILEGGSAVSDIQVLVDDRSTGQSSITFSASELTAGASKSLEYGRFRFTVTITAATLTTFQGAAYVYESSLAATLVVQPK